MPREKNETARKGVLHPHFFTMKPYLHMHAVQVAGRSMDSMSYLYMLATQRKSGYVSGWLNQLSDRAYAKMTILFSSNHPWMQLRQTKERNQSLTHYKQHMTQYHASIDTTGNIIAKRINSIYV